jgi:ribosomal protein S20
MKSSKVKKLVATVALAGAVAAGTGGAAYAADASGSGTSSGTAATTAHPRLRLAARRHAIKIVAETLGVTRDELRAALKGGQSITEYAQSLGKDPQTVKDALVNAANKAIDKAVANGRIDETQATEIKSKVTERVDTLMNRHFGQTGAAQPKT